LIEQNDLAWCPPDELEAAVKAAETLQALLTGLVAAL
jgi:hypothetical protein